MKFCSKCGKEIMDEAVICPSCGCAVTNSNAPATATEVDEVNVGLCVVGALIPLFGFIYWPLKHKVTPKKAKAVGITAIVSWAVGMLFSILYSVVFAGLMSEYFSYLY